MEEESSLSIKIIDFVKGNPLFVSLLAIGLILCALGLFQYISSQQNSSTLKLITEDKPESTNITVDIQGQVISPGVKNIPAGSRVADAIAAAGGLASEADNEYISKRLNLAKIIVDGSKIYIPAIDETSEDVSVLGSSDIVDTVAEDLPVLNSQIVNINDASLEQLDTLPRIGPVTAQKIVDNRPYGSIEELVSKKVMGQKTFDGLRDMIVSQ